MEPRGDRLRYDIGSPTVIDTTDAFVPSGRYLFFPGRSTAISVTTPVEGSLDVDGAAVVIGDEGVPGRERILTFTGTADAFVHTEEPLPQGSSVELVGPDGDVVPDWDFDRAWRLPLDGRYRLHVAPGNAASQDPLTVRLRRAVTLPALTYGAAPTRFDTGSEGRWVVAELALPASDVHQLTSSAPSLNGAWEAVLSGASTSRCSPDPHGPLGCGENPRAVVGPEHAASVYTTLSPGGPHLVVLRARPGVTGGVDLGVGPVPMP